MDVMMANERSPLNYLEWVALNTLYRLRERVSSPLSYVGLPSTIKTLINHQPPLAAWVGAATNHQVHITAAGIALMELTHKE
jgi:hypothetical protein